MELREVGMRIEYFHGSSDEHLTRLGVDRRLLPSPEKWWAFYEQDYARTIQERQVYSLVWELDGEAVGFSATDQIKFGEEAFMHLHIVSADLRHAGRGEVFVRQSVPIYFEALQLQRLFCEPNAFNTAPNRTLQRAGFRYLFTHETTPGPINFPQAATRWVIEGEPNK